MRTWAEELQKYTHDYVRRGGKQNRKKQVSLIIDFLEYTDSTEKLMSLERLGKRHVINFWKSHRNLSEKVSYDYWLGICKLWEWINKPEKPPKPNTFNKPDSEVSIEANKRASNTVFTDLSSAIKYSRKAIKMPVQELANRTGLEVSIIESVENGKTDIYLSDIRCLFDILKIKFTFPMIR